MSEWQGKSDFEINKAVAEAYQLEQGGFVKQSKTPTDDGYAYHYCDSVGVYSNIGEFCGVKDYCNNPSDSWPIIYSNNIGVYAISDSCYEIGMSNFTGYWNASGVNSLYGEFGMDEVIFELVDKNPLRAAMIVYLEMNGVKP